MNKYIIEITDDGEFFGPIDAQTPIEAINILKKKSPELFRNIFDGRGEDIIEERDLDLIVYKILDTIKYACKTVTKKETKITVLNEE